MTERKVPKIRTDNVYPPIPVRMFDWQAVYDDDDEPDDDGRMAVGHGATEADAIRDLMDNHPRSGNPCSYCKKPFFFGDTCSMAGSEHCDFVCPWRNSEDFCGSTAWKKKHGIK